ncbi:hypothetical protein K438DRAFT_104202 [Mycena galopus ATCC 62051]|nr:hypothetical protein K438DRAFT_104202 [Mycena galopus ATCC 62051]
MSSSSLRDFVSETGRKAWRKTKERTESVWTPVLEASLIEALEKYRPTTPPRDNKRPTRALLRFPKRNQYISAHIFATTGVRRTPKQVGSRLRQLQEVCEDARIFNLIFRRDFAQDSTIDLSMPSDSSASLDDASSAAPSPVASASDYSDIADDAGLPPRTYITIELVQPSSSFAPDEQNIRSPPTNPNPNQHFISLEYPSDIETNDPVLAFSTFKKISTSQYYSYFWVLIGGVFVHSEVAELTFASSPPRPGPSSLVEAQQRYTYNIKLVPQYWAHLCRTAREFPFQ